MAGKINPNSRRQMLLAHLDQMDDGQSMVVPWDCANKIANAKPFMADRPYHVVWRTVEKGVAARVWRVKGQVRGQGKGTS